MSNNVKTINTKNRTYYFFNDIIDIENFHPNSIKYSYLLYWICNNKRILKNIYCRSLYLVFRYANEYFEEIDGSKYLTLAPSLKI